MTNRLLNPISGQRVILTLECSVSRSLFYPLGFSIQCRNVNPESRVKRYFISSIGGKSVTGLRAGVSGHRDSPDLPSLLRRRPTDADALAGGVTARTATGRVIALQSTVLAGWVRAERFYTHEQAAAHRIEGGPRPGASRVGVQFRGFRSSSPVTSGRRNSRPGRTDPWRLWPQRWRPGNS